MSESEKGVRHFSRFEKCLTPSGQSMLEYAVLVAAVVSALIVMTDYIRRAFNAHAESVEQELNAATVDNAP